MTVPPEGFDVRQARDDDAASLISLYEACWGEYEGMILDTEDEMAHLNHVASHYRRLDGYAWIAERGGEIAGSVAWRPLDGGGAELQMLYVMPKARRKGLASFLVGMVEREIAEHQVPTIELWSDTRFTDAHRLYRSLGWQQLDETRYVDDLSKSTEFHFVKPSV
jgi:GNAT superfamily N-acetyltransferase